MKLQIISRLQHHEHLKKEEFNNTKTTSKDSLNQKHQNYLAENIQNYMSALQDSNTLKKSEPKSTNPLQFFKNFQQSCVVKYKPANQSDQNIKRKLEWKLRQIAACQKENQPDNRINQAFTFSQNNFNQPTLVSYQSVPNSQNDKTKDYYFVHQKPKERVRKFNSVISINYRETANNEERKPGFILKRNLSLCQKDMKDPQNHQSKNKENININNIITEPTLSRVQSKEKLEKVEDQISQSKQRIAKIRKQLNEIYQTRRGNHPYKLKLF